MDIVTGSWTTPGGHRVGMAYRPGTSDWNTISSVMAPHDEYDLSSLAINHPGMVAVDVGAHVGSVSVALLIDNPELRVVAVEPVPDNVRLIRLNAEMNGLTDRLTILENAAGGPGPVSVWYGYQGSETVEHHRFIGNSTLAYDGPGGNSTGHEEVVYQTPVSLYDLLDLADGHIAFLKADCEGGEWSLLDAEEEALGNVDLIIGEFHPVRGHRRDDLLPLLEKTHVVAFPEVPAGVDPMVGPGHFVAALWP